ncbi:chemotaxis protein CheW [Crenobacter sp. SG2303]|uniref:Chemotaxis protein CheW n=1 Tax=Crenobacter oryzisoli TaxID=3056844 RepID=A0ABT7XT89_9NEIS|nr:chemotaxis protein CheW [Crenobacter sp. SG2303]MDN0077001.1 chemotaxis protein CheW [Crenobacter sp. SG2303]
MSQATALTRRDASAADAVEAEAGAKQYLTFTLNAQLFAVGILNIKEIIEYHQLTEIPLMPAFIHGVINLRGAVVPVIDLSARFGAKPTAIGRRTCIVIVEMHHRVDGADIQQDIGILVDSVNEVLEIPADEIEPAPAFGATIRADFIFGMGKVAGRFVIILDLDRVLSIDEMGQIAALSHDEKG